jgi:serine/threonine protein kinase
MGASINNFDPLKAPVARDFFVDDNDDYNEYIDQVWSVGILAYYLCNFKYPTKKETFRKLKQKYLNNLEFCDKYDENFKDIILKMLIINPSNRPTF